MEDGEIIHFRRISIHSKKNYSFKTHVNDAVYIAITITQVVQFYSEMRQKFLVLPI